MEVKCKKKLDVGGEGQILRKTPLGNVPYRVVNLGPRSSSCLSRDCEMESRSRLAMITCAKARILHARIYRILGQEISRDLDNCRALVFILWVWCGVRFCLQCYMRKKCVRLSFLNVSITYNHHQHWNIMNKIHFKLENCVAINEIIR